ncbi:MAG TPA: peptidase, partial [Verrucomicrobiota bacterium]|nr:peptidase [Verrucomicrobiota bacterium]
MAESKKKGGEGTPSRPLPDDAPMAALPPLHKLLTADELERLSALQLLDLIASRIPPHESAAVNLHLLRERIVALDDLNDQARQALEKLEDIVQKLPSPAFRV